MRVRRTVLIAIGMACAAGSVGAQVEPVRQVEPRACEAELQGADFVDVSADVSRLVDLLEQRSRHSFLIRRLSDRIPVDACAAPATLEQLTRRLALPPLPAHGALLLPVDVRVVGNTTYPRDWNDGALWGGAGLGTAVTSGAALRWGIVEAALAPEIVLHQNANFDIYAYPDISSYSRYVNRWHGRYIDLPQRFGTDALMRLSAGQSHVRLSTRGFRVGLSNENLAWGPARRNPILLSGTAPGFAHVFIETARPHDVRIGDAEFQLLWGRLTESDWFDYEPDNDHRALAGSVVTLRPRGLDGLYLGAAYQHIQTWWPGTSAGDLLIAPFTGLDPDSSGLPRNLRLFGLFMRWTAAPGGFEVYGEWARQDSWQEWVRLLNRTDAPQAYTLGLQRIVRRGDNAVRFTAELSHLSDALAHRDLGRGRLTWYISPHVPQGHTHRGQLLGAPIGPGSEAQFIGADVFWSLGRSSLSVERARYDDDAYYAVWGQNHGPHGHDTEMSFRLGHAFAGPTFSVEAELGYSFRYSRWFLGIHHVNSPDFPYLRETNYGLRLAARWQPSVPAWEFR
ncbi:MAG TPA: hypothetical protein VFZ69_12075 [Longimicrobiales bacterium]